MSKSERCCITSAACGPACKAFGQQVQKEMSAGTLTGRKLFTLTARLGRSLGLRGDFGGRKPSKKAAKRRSYRGKK